MGAARAKRRVISFNKDGESAVSAGRVAETPHWRQRMRSMAGESAEKPRGGRVRRLASNSDEGGSELAGGRAACGARRGG